MTYWVIINGDPEGTWYWSGYNSAIKDHMFSRNPENAIKFFDEDSAKRSGVNLTRGTRIEPVSA